MTQIAITDEHARNALIAALYDVASVTATATPLFLGGSYIYDYGTTTAYGQSTGSTTLEAGVAASSGRGRVQRRSKMPPAARSR